MARFSVCGARLAGCSVVLGEHRSSIDATPAHYGNDPARLERLKRVIGMGERYTAAAGTTTGDMCLQAATALLRALACDPGDLGAVVSVTQTPDYLMPGNAHILHGRLGCPRETAALDVSLGCSGFVYGLWLSALTAAAAGRAVLLAAGDTLSKKAGKNDRTTAPLFGDAGSAALILPSPHSHPMYFILRADGGQFEKMYIPAGGARRPSTTRTRRKFALADGGSRSVEDVFMDGFGIFSFTMAEQPQLLADILEYSGQSVQSIDYCILHQANRYIVETITRKAGIPAEKAPSDAFARFGNQNSASIPGVLCGTLADALRGRTLRAVLQGYGTGLSWGACQLALEDCLCLPPVRYGLSPNDSFVQ